MQCHTSLKAFLAVSVGVFLCGSARAVPKAVTKNAASQSAAPAPVPVMQKRWLFFWRDMSDPKQVDRTIAQFPRAQADGYNAVVFSSNVAPAKASEFKSAAKKYGLGLVAMVMGGAHDPNYEEGVPAQDALFVAHGGAATFQPDNPTQVANGDFEDVIGNHFNGWSFQDSEGVTTFADHAVTHGGKAALRMENPGKNDGQHCRIMQTVALQPHRQYHVSFWMKTQDMAGGFVGPVGGAAAAGCGGRPSGGRPPRGARRGPRPSRSPAGSR